MVVDQGTVDDSGSAYVVEPFEKDFETSFEDEGHGELCFIFLILKWVLFVYMRPCDGIYLSHQHSMVRGSSSRRTFTFVVPVCLQK